MKRGVCRICGCTEKDACRLDSAGRATAGAGETCAWINDKETLCSNPLCYEGANKKPTPHFVKRGYVIRTLEGGKRVAYTIGGKMIGLPQLADYLMKFGIRPDVVVVDEFLGHTTLECVVGYSKRRRKWYGWAPRRFGQALLKGPSTFKLMLENGYLIKAFATRAAAEKFAMAIS